MSNVDHNLEVNTLEDGNMEVIESSTIKMDFKQYNDIHDRTVELLTAKEEELEELKSSRDDAEKTIKMLSEHIKSLKSKVKILAEHL